MCFSFCFILNSVFHHQVFQWSFQWEKEMLDDKKCITKAASCVCVCVFSTLHFSSFSEISFFVKAKRDILTAWKNGREWRKGKLGLQKTFLHCTLHFTMPIKRRTLQQNNRSQKEHLHFDDYNSDDALQKWQISTYRKVWYLANATSRASVPSFMIFMIRLN